MPSYEVVVYTYDHGTIVEDALSREDVEDIWVSWVEEPEFQMLRIVDRFTGLMVGNASALNLKWRDGAVKTAEEVFHA